MNFLELLFHSNLDEILWNKEIFQRVINDIKKQCPNVMTDYRFFNFCHHNYSKKLYTELKELVIEGIIIPNKELHIATINKELLSSKITNKKSKLCYEQECAIKIFVQGIEINSKVYKYENINESFITKLFD